MYINEKSIPRMNIEAKNVNTPDASCLKPKRFAIIL